MGVNEKMTAIADAIRDKTGKTEALGLDAMAKSVGEVYEAGQKSEYDDFWDTFQQNGNRTNYACGFAGSGWTDALFKPKYDICPTDGYMLFRSSSITDLKNLPVKLDFSKVTNTQYMFQWSLVKHLGKVDIRALTNVPTGMFAYASSLVAIDKLILKDDGTQRLTGDMFTNATGLTNLAIEGVIGTSLSFQWSKKLSKESITSIINALSADKTGLTVTFSKTAKEAAFPEEEEEEWNALTGTKTNWKISLV